jgi:acetolactate synthase regulatory subunit
MNSILQVRLRDDEGGIVRLLGMVRRRGYEVVQLSANRAKDERCFDLVMVVEGDRSPQVLVRQMARMLEVEKVHLFDSGPGCSAPGDSEPREKPEGGNGKTNRSHSG